MDNTINRDPVAMEFFAGRLMDFCDTMDHKAQMLAGLCEEAERIMEGQNGAAVSQRLAAMAEQIRRQVASGRAMSGRITRSAAMLEQSEKGE